MRLKYVVKSDSRTLTIGLELKEVENNQKSFHSDFIYKLFLRLIIFNDRQVGEFLKFPLFKIKVLGVLFLSNRSFPRYLPLLR